MADSSAMPVMMPGSAIGNTNSSVNDVLAGEAAARERQRRERAEHERSQRGHTRHRQRQPHRCPDVAAREGDFEPVQRQSRRREVVGAILGREGVQKDDQHRKVHEREPGVCGDARAPSGTRLERIERSEALRERQIDRDQHDRHDARNAAASGMFPAVPCC